jgi:hypothetical protein
VTDFPCFCPVALAGIGGLPDTVLDRSIVVRLQRAPQDRVGGRRVRFRERRQRSDKIVPHLVAHAPAIANALAVGATNVPASLDDRARDNWDCMTAVAELAGGPWPAWAAQSAEALSGARSEGAGLVEKLLEDIREIVEVPRRRALAQWRVWSAWHAAVEAARARQKTATAAAPPPAPKPKKAQPVPLQTPTARPQQTSAASRDQLGRAPARPCLADLPQAILSENLIGLLRMMTHLPWMDLSHGRPITERWMADRLRGLGVVPGRGRVPEWPFDVDGEEAGAYGLGRNRPGPPPQRRAYKIADLRAAWRRCLPPPGAKP